MRNYSFTVGVALALLLVGGAYADTFWTGNGDGVSWNDPLNWDTFMVPDEYSGETWLRNGNITIYPGEVQNPGLYSQYARILGPEWGGTLNIYGTLNYNWHLSPVQWDINNPSTINMYGNSRISGEGIALGMNWWWNDGPYVNMNMYGSSTVDINFFFWGGKLNLYGGTFDVAFGVADGAVGQVSDATRMMDIYEGKLILGFGDQTALVQNWIARGVLKAYGGVGVIQIDTTSLPGQTVVTAIPEPAGLALIGLVSLLGLRRRRQ